jgi:CDP-6-deoxy-D-xylo-4-hexulose-3-dehydrase
MDDLSVDIEHLKVLFETETPACMILVPVLGLVPDMQQISDLCKKHNVILLIDNCEAQGSLYKGVRLEKFGYMASCSTYFGHIMSTIEGGMITTDDEEMYMLLKMLRSHGWGRDIDEAKKNELETRYNVSKFNSLYTFYYPAFNLRSTDLQAFIGLLQLKRLQEVTFARNENYKSYSERIYNTYWKPADKDLYVFVSNMGYPVIHPSRDAMVADLQKNNVEVRPLISGSMGQQPFFVERYGRQVLPNAEMVDKYGFYLPNHPYLDYEDIKFICSVINKYTAD